MARHGIPETLVSDNGPQFSSKEFVLFSKDYGFNHTNSSPGHASGNGEVERAVRTIKGLLYAAQDPYAALLNYRSTSLANGYSPAELLMSRKIRTKIPELPRNLQPALPHQLNLEEKERASRLNMKLNFDKYHAVKSLPILRNGDEVWLRDRMESGRVERQLNGESSRSYVTATPTATVRRNRIQLNKLPDGSGSKRKPAEPNLKSKSPEVKPPETINKSVHVLKVPQPQELAEKGQIRTRSGRLVKKPIRFNT